MSKTLRYLGPDDHLTVDGSVVLDKDGEAKEVSDAHADILLSATGQHVEDVSTQPAPAAAKPPKGSTPKEEV